MHVPHEEILRVADDGTLILSEEMECRAVLSHLFDGNVHRVTLLPAQPESEIIGMVELSVSDEEVARRFHNGQRYQLEVRLKPITDDGG